MKHSHYLSIPFIEKLMRCHAPEKDIRVQEVHRLPMDNSASILAALTAGRSEKIIGHFGLSVVFESGGRAHTRRMVLKIKPHGREISDMLQALAGACGSPLARVYPVYQALTGFINSHMRELEVYGKLTSGLQPEIFGMEADYASESYVILMEYLEDVALLNSVMRPQEWSDTHIKQALKQLAAWHARNLSKTLPVEPIYWQDAPSRAYMIQLMPLWQGLLDNAAQKFPDLYTADRVPLLQQAIADIPVYWQELERLPKTLVHNDMNPRNTCFKVVDDALLFCVYDWELATYHVPQYDVVELLCFILDENRYALRQRYIEFYRQALLEQSGQYADEWQFKRGFVLAALDFGLHRLGLYMMGHSVSPYPFLPRVVNSYFDTLSQTRSWL